MANWRGLLDRARRIADETLPPEVKEAGRKLRDEVARRAPAPVAEVLAQLGGELGGESTAPEGTAGDNTPAQPSRDEILRRVHEKAEHGLKPEDSLVVIYATPAEAEEVASIRNSLEGIDTTIREIDLDRERPQTARQIAQLTGIMVPPYVYINGRYWGGQFEMITLRASGDLEKVIANRLDEIGEEARRIGGVHESYSEDITVENIVKRWRLGHILCVDDLDAWFEIDKQGEERFFYQGAPHPIEEMSQVAKEIVDGHDAEDFEANWLLEPAVHLN